MSTLVLIAALFVTYVVVTCTRNYFLLPRSFHGPFLASISELWLVYQSATCQLQGSCYQLLHQHGPVVRIGPNKLITNDPEILRHISSPKSQWTRAGWYDAFELGGTTKNVFAERDEQKHKELRAKLGYAYSGKGVSNLEASIDARTQDLIALLRIQHAQSRKVLDLARLSAFYALDVLSTVAFGKAFGFLQSNTDKWNYVALNDNFIPVIDLVCHNSTIRSMFQNPIVQKLLAPKETDEVGFGRVARFASDAIAARFSSNGEDDGQGKDSMLAAFRANGLSLEECKSESLLQILAGSDSTSNWIRNTTLRIITCPRIYHALQHEIDNAVAAGLVDQDFIISDAQARKLPYLQAVLWEGLRKQPPLLGFSNKTAPPGGETINGIYFPAGCEVAVCIDAVTHHKPTFGDDVDLFKPERWLEAGSDFVKRYERVTELAFGSGRYGCLGRNIAWMEVGKVIFELVGGFEWQVMDAVRPVREHRANANWLQSGMDVVVTERRGR